MPKPIRTTDWKVQDPSDGRERVIHGVVAVGETKSEVADHLPAIKKVYDVFYGETEKKKKAFEERRLKIVGMRLNQIAGYTNH